MEIQKPRIAKVILRKKNGTEGINLPDFRLYYKLQSSRQYGPGTKTEIQINGTEQKAQRQIHTPIGHLTFDKGGKNIQWRKDNLFNKWCRENWSTICKRMKLEHFVTPYTKIISKWIKDLNKIRNYKTPRGKLQQNTL